MTVADDAFSSARPTAAGAAPVMLTAEEAARVLKVKQSWLERQAAARKVPFSMLGGSYRFSARHLAEIVRMNEVEPSLSAEQGPPANSKPKARRAADIATGLELLRPRPRPGPRTGGLSDCSRPISAS